MEKIDKKIRSFRDLEIWKKSIELTTDIYHLTSKFPQSEMYGLTSQLRRAAVSIPSNISEGSSRDSTKEFIHFLTISNGSLSEIETQIEIALNLRYIPQNGLQTQINHLRSMLCNLIKVLKEKTQQKVER